MNLLQNTKEYIANNHNYNIPTVKALETKSSNDIISEFTNEAQIALTPLVSGLSEQSLRSWMESEKTRLEASLEDASWKDEFRGKNLFSTFCSSVFGENELKVRQAYIDIALAEKPDVFVEIKAIFESFV